MAINSLAASLFSLCVNLPKYYVLNVTVFNTHLDYSSWILILNTHIEYAYWILVWNTRMHYSCSILYFIIILNYLNTPTEYFTLMTHLYGFTTENMKHSPKLLSNHSVLPNVDRALQNDFCWTPSEIQVELGGTTLSILGQCHTITFSKNRRSQKWSKNIFSSLICPLKMTNDIEYLSLTLHSVNRHFIEWPPIVKMTKSAIVGTVGKIFPPGEYHFTPLCLLMGQVLIAYAWGAEHILVFDKSALNGLRNGPGVRYSKLQNRSSRSSHGTPMYWYLMK